MWQEWLCAHDLVVVFRWAWETHWLGGDRHHHEAAHTSETELHIQDRSLQRLADRALGEACAAGALRIAAAALERGACIDTADTDAAMHGATPLMRAAFAGSTSGTAWCVEAGAALEIRNLAYSQTALAIACSRGNWACARLLLAAGANPAVEDGDGWTPLRIAQEMHGRLEPRVRDCVHLRDLLAMVR